MAMDFSDTDPALSPCAMSAGQHNSTDNSVEKIVSQESELKTSLVTDSSHGQLSDTKHTTGQERISSTSTAKPSSSSLKRRAIAALRVHFDQNGVGLESHSSSSSESISDATTSRKTLEEYIVRLQQKIQSKAHILVDQSGRLNLCKAINETKIWLRAESGKSRKAKDYGKRLETLRRDGCKIERKLDEAEKAIKEYESVLENIRNILASGQCSTGMLTLVQKDRLESLLSERTAWLRGCLTEPNISLSSREKHTSLTHFYSETQMMTEAFSEIVNFPYLTGTPAPVDDKDMSSSHFRGADTDSLENDLDSYSESAHAEATILRSGTEKFKDNTYTRSNSVYCQKTCTTPDNLYSNMEETFCCDDALSEHTTSNFNESYSQPCALLKSSNSTSITIEPRESNVKCLHCTRGRKVNELDNMDHSLISPEPHSGGKGRHVSFADDLDTEFDLPTFSNPDYTETLNQMSNYASSISSATDRLLSIEYEVFSSTRYNTQELNTVLRTIRNRIRQYASSCLKSSQEFQRDLQTASTSHSGNSTKTDQRIMKLAEAFVYTSQTEWNNLNTHVTKCMFWLTSKAESGHSGYAKVYNCARQDLVDYQCEVTKAVSKVHSFLKEHFTTRPDSLMCAPQFVQHTCVPPHSLDSPHTRPYQRYPSTACKRCGLANHYR